MPPIAPKPYLSAYLQPEPQRLRAAPFRQTGYRHAWLLTRLRLALETISGRAWASLGLWAILFSVGLYAFQHQNLPAVPASVAAADNPLQPGSTQASALHVVAKAPTLPDGPTGQLLPPGTMAPQGAYANSYSHGQCTWYVASRRLIPNGWGNARTWFAHAQSAGWATGTTPAIAAIAWTPNGYYGHVALVEDVNTATSEVLISEMNYLGPYLLDKRWVSASAFKYIY